MSAGAAETLMGLGAFARAMARNERSFLLGVAIEMENAVRWRLGSEREARRKARHFAREARWPMSADGALEQRKRIYRIAALVLFAVAREAFAADRKGPA